MMKSIQKIDDAYRVEYDKTLEEARIRWSTYQQERLQHEEMESVARKFIGQLEKEIQALHSEYVPKVVNGIAHPTQGTVRTNQFLAELLKQWEYQSSTYRKSSQPVFQFFQQELEKIRSRYRFDLVSGKLANQHLPKAIDWSDLKLSKLLGRFLALSNFQRELSERNTQAINMAEAEGSGKRLSAKQSVALLMTLLHEAVGEGVVSINIQAFARLTKMLTTHSFGNLVNEAKAWKDNTLSDHRGNLEQVRTLLTELNLSLKLTELESVIDRGHAKQIERMDK